MSKTPEQLIEEKRKDLVNDVYIGIHLEGLKQVIHFDVVVNSVEQSLYDIFLLGQQDGERRVEAKYKEIFDWLLGLNGDFPNLAEKPHYRFRTELRERLSSLSHESVGKEE